jgi:hypothetical protein
MKKLILIFSISKIRLFLHLMCAILYGCDYKKDVLFKQTQLYSTFD